MTRDPVELERRRVMIAENCNGPAGQGCGTCVFFLEGFEVEAKSSTDPGFCRRGIIGAPESGWPKRQVGSWCGEYVTLDEWEFSAANRAMNVAARKASTENKAHVQ